MQFFRQVPLFGFLLIAYNVMVVTMGVQSPDVNILETEIRRIRLPSGRVWSPDWQDAIQPLRVGLTEHGWNTLSIQMPVLEKTAKYFDYLPVFPAAVGRIEAAIAYLKEQGNKRIVVLAHSCGFHMANHWLNAKVAEATRQFDAFVGVGMGATDYGQPMQEAYALEKIKGPVLDLYGAEDYPAVLRMAPKRKVLLVKAGNPKSRQLMIPDADHYFKDRGEPLVEAVAAWLATLRFELPQ